MGDYIVQQDDLNMKYYIGEYLKKFFPELRSSIQLPIPKYIDIFFIFIEFNKYLARYFERRSKIDYTLDLDRISVSYRIKKKFQKQNLSCLAAAGVLVGFVNKFSNPDERTSFAKTIFGIGTSEKYNKMLKMRKEA